MNEQLIQLLPGGRVPVSECRPLSGVEAFQSRAEPGARWAAGLGVIPGQRRAGLARGVTGGHRLHQVLVAAPGRHHPDGHDHRAPPPEAVVRIDRLGGQVRASAPQHPRCQQCVWNSPRSKRCRNGASAVAAAAQASAASEVIDTQSSPAGSVPQGGPQHLRFLTRG